MWTREEPTGDENVFVLNVMGRSLQPFVNFRIREIKFHFAERLRIYVPVCTWCRIKHSGEKLRCWGTDQICSSQEAWCLTLYADHTTRTVYRKWRRLPTKNYSPRATGIACHIMLWCFAPFWKLCHFLLTSLCHPPGTCVRDVRPEGVCVTQRHRDAICCQEGGWEQHCCGLRELKMRHM